jgi:hypothetical protein
MRTLYNDNVVERSIDFGNDVDLEITNIMLITGIK